MKYNYNSDKIKVFHGRMLPEEGFLAGYSALINTLNLQVPLPDKLSMISEKHKRYSTEEWEVFTPRHAPANDLYGHLTFALKYEGIDLYIFKAVFKIIPKKEIEKMVTAEPTGQYSRKIWFLYEWLMEEKLEIDDLKTGNFTDLLDLEMQYPGLAENSSRHRIRNNLPGVKDFCPLIRRTEKLDTFIAKNLSGKTEKTLNKIRKDVLMRASAFLLLKDSKASYAIEGESPTQSRMQRWGRAIGQAGYKPLTKEELLRLQQIVIENTRFIKMGWRNQGGFVGEHDRATGAPIPDHISAKWQDLDTLINGLIATNNKLQNEDYDPVLAATLIAFGFVFIHPFVDGNGRIQRYLIHHVLAAMKFARKGMIFPVSSAILQRMDEYKEVLEAYSIPRLELIQWKQTKDNNVEVLNDTIDLYRYFDATRQAEFLYSCVQQTVDEIIPEEVDYLLKYDLFKSRIDNRFEMPDKMVSLLLRFLAQGNGRLSKRVKEKEFKELSEVEVQEIEEVYWEVFGE